MVHIYVLMGYKFWSLYTGKVSMSFISSFKGVLGETVINIAMWLKLDKEVYHRLNNITLLLERRAVMVWSNTG